MITIDELKEKSAAGPDRIPGNFLEKDKGIDSRTDAVATETEPG